MSRFVVDTNIIIPLEDSSKILEPVLGKLLNGLNGDHKIFYHPATVEDIHRDKDELRREISLSRLSKYQVLECTNFSDLEIAKVLGKATTPNNECDNRILFSLFRNEIDYLVTEDRGVHKKAKNIGISERVFYIQQAYSRFIEQVEKPELYVNPIINIERLSDVNIEDSIYESLRGDYSGFEEWYCRAQRSGRKCWTVRGEEDEISSICIVKNEENTIFESEKKGLNGKILKICTFKVAPLNQGRRLGEMMLKKAFFEAVDGEYRYIYMTIRQGGQEHLIDLIEKFGFLKFSEDIIAEGEIDNVYVRKVRPETEIECAQLLENPFQFYPIFNSSVSEGCMLPVQPKYHKILFSDYSKQKNLFNSFDRAVSNSMRQAYISNANIKPLVRGSLVLFYRTRDYKEVTGIGVVDSSYRSSDYYEILKSIRKITVYTDEEVADIAEREALVVIFQSVLHFHDKIDLACLHSMGLKGNLQTARFINRELLEKMLGVVGAENYISTN